MTFTLRDAKSVSALVTKKLELYMNYERREKRFDPQGCLQTTPQMHTFDLMYQMLDKAELNRKSKRSNKVGEKQMKNSKSPLKTETNVKSMTRENHQSAGDCDLGNSVLKAKHDEELESKQSGLTIHPNLLDNSRRMISRKEAERITKLVNEVFAQQDLDKLHIIHRYRPHSSDVALVTENGKVANYTMHVGSALNSKYYVDYYLREGLQTGKKEHAKRLQKLNTKKQKNGDLSQRIPAKD